MNSVAYNNLAEVYDSLMSYVPYQNWVGIIERVCKKYYKNSAPTIFELGGGTGTLGAILTFEGYNYKGSDFSEGMCRIAYDKGLDFTCVDGRSIGIKEQFDMVVFLFDGINYLLTEDDYKRCFLEVSKILKPNGLFLFDITTKYNSTVNFDDYEEAESFENGCYIRHSYYERGTTIQHNEFDIYVKDDESELYHRFEEHHRQRVFDPSEIEAFIPTDIYSIEGIYDGFSSKAYRSDSERVHFLLRLK